MSWPKEFLAEGNKIINKINLKTSTPNKEDILRFLNTDPSNIKVVILGQDPYPTKGVANGNAFAVNKGMKLPQSLNNIFKEIKEINGVINADETLTHWTNQGVLLLNASLTTKIGEPNAHKHLWKNYTKKLYLF